MSKLFFLRLLHLLAVSGYIGSIFAMIVLGRTHDSSSQWEEVLTSRTDIWRILVFVNLPSLGVFLVTDLLMLRFRSRIKMGA